MTLNSRELIGGNKYLLLSLAIHLIILILIIQVKTGRITPHSSIQATIFFEKSATRTTRTVSPKRQTSKVGLIRKKAPTINSDSILASKKYKFTDLEQNQSYTIPKSKLDSRINLKKYIVPPNSASEKKNDIQGFLKGNKRLELESPSPPVQEKSHSNISKTDSKQATTVKSDQQASTPAPINQVPARQAESRVSQNEASSAIASDKADPLAIWKRKKDLDVYKSILARLITANWVVPPVGVTDFQVIVEALIDRNGNLGGIEILKSSGLVILDTAAERAIRVSTPFPKFPSSFDSKMKQFKAVFRFTPESVGN